ncbi:MAG TPA: family 43 glycosylhydrolase [Chloroflexia bacterium]|jgi:arabinan endo-1,5-alpha-L-arabinosidase
MHKSFQKRLPFIWQLLLMALLVGMPGVATAQESQDNQDNQDHRTRFYHNPLQIRIPDDGRVETCADPNVIKGQQPGDRYWYLYCTTDPLNSEDRNKNGDFNFHLIPMMKSMDLVDWTYVGDAFATRPGWVADDAGLWAPEVQYFNNQYYLYYTASWTDLPGGGSAIGVATSPNPTGPWTDSGSPAVEPHAPPCCPTDRRWVFDPDVIEANGQRYIFYGSYFGGISARTLSPDGLHSDPASQTQITIANRYEGSEVVFHNGYYYLFASATDCCRGPLTGYSVFAGRSQNILGPYVDREGASLLAGRVGGTPVISMNGNRWVGTGHQVIFKDYDGQYWTIYHAVDRNDPYFEGAVGFTKRPALLDPLDWINGWPTVRAGNWASDERMPAPAAQPGSRTQYRPRPPRDIRLGQLNSALSDEFNGTTLDPRWTWVRQPATTTYGLGDGTFRFDTQAADLFEGNNTASVLTEATPSGDFVVETKVKLNVPPEGCCFNYTQAGLVVYANDDNYVKLAHVSIWDTRQTEFAKELFPVPAGFPRYGNTVVGPPDDWTYLRIAKERQHRDGGDEHGQEQYTAYTSRDGTHWVRGGTWTHNLGSSARIGLVSMGGSGFVANFDYVRVYRLNR